MSDVQRYEDLIAWQKARELSREIYRASSQSPLRRDRVLVDQMRRAAVSVMSNIAEGFERQASLAEFSHFLSVAKGSCGEIRSQLFVAFDAGYLEQTTFESLIECATEVSRVVGGLRTAVERRRSQ